eukprot:TRINITY_DN46632_c3_g1_i2.p1 TRINITY_DN46632_c3_g1~~TRINITY_DN46632_c3_g1_i2.p1  ORF type:complete len:124 (+),score=27.37 TRINITY_DN46632_c3_g1_i2:232-603(+)
MGQDRFLGCKLFKTRGLCRGGLGGSESREKCFKGLGLYSKPFIEEEEQSQGEEGELESLRHRGKGPQEPASEVEEEDCSDAEEASSQGSSGDGENDEQEDRDSGEREETVKCSLEGEKSGGRT